MIYICKEFVKIVLHLISILYFPFFNFCGSETKRNFESSILLALILGLTIIKADFDFEVWILPSRGLDLRGTARTHLFVELVDDALGPLEVQVLAFQGPVDVGQFDAHLTHQQPVVLIGPVDAGRLLVPHLEGQKGSVGGGLLLES